jgi:hypothetical protein
MALTSRPVTQNGSAISRLGQPASGLETGQHRSTARRHQAWNGSASQIHPWILAVPTPGTEQTATLGDLQDGQTKRSGLAARNSERGQPIPCLGQPPAA